MRSVGVSPEPSQLGECLCFPHRGGSARQTSEQLLLRAKGKQKGSGPGWSPYRRAGAQSRPHAELVNAACPPHTYSASGSCSCSLSHLTAASSAGQSVASPRSAAAPDRQHRAAGGKKLLQLHLELWKEFTARIKTTLQLPNKADTCKAAGASETACACGRNPRSASEPAMKLVTLQQTRSEPRSSVFSNTGPGRHAPETQAHPVPFQKPNARSWV